jgi:hypothetical protein
MHVVYARQPFPAEFRRAIFLAGPTPRSPEVRSWRPRALELLAERGYDGAVFVPEDQSGDARFDYTDQIDWESEGLALADVIVFWIPRDLDTLPGFTTNVEWGIWMRSGKCVLGAPREAPKLRYLQHHADALGIPQFDDLAATLDAALARLGDGALRRGGEREVPLEIWRQPGFQSWLRAQQGAGHRLDGAQLEWQFRSKPERPLFCWALKVNVYIPQEQRHKRGEVVISRSDIAAVLAYHRGATLLDTRIVLVREFRSNAATQDGFVHELPGGSSPHDIADARVVAAAELHEETGVEIAAERFVHHGARQCMATMISHRAELYSVELDADEIARFEAHQGRRFGESDTERTYVEVRSLADILAATDVDWTHVGMMLSVLSG